MVYGWWSYGVQEGSERVLFIRKGRQTEMNDSQFAQRRATVYYRRAAEEDVYDRPVRSIFAAIHSTRQSLELWSKNVKWMKKPFD